MNTQEQITEKMITDATEILGEMVALSYKQTALIDQMREIKDAQKGAEDD